MDQDKEKQSSEQVGTNPSVTFHIKATYANLHQNNIALVPTTDQVQQDALAAFLFDFQ